MLLAIDTTTRLSGIALYDAGGLRMEQLWETGNNHTAELVPCISRACEGYGLAPADLQAVAVALGPGSFTGVRVGMSVAKGIALALQIPILGVSTLDATAYAHSRDVLPVCALVAAGRSRWCVGFYETDRSSWRRRGDPTLADAQQLANLLERPTLVCGELSAELRVTLNSLAGGRAILASQASSVRRAGFLAELAWKRLEQGEKDDLASLAPLYLQSV
jgi:tRNA threonylcarbamoyladenosine biosynthesis protein TsaB